MNSVRIFRWALLLMVLTLAIGAYWITINPANEKGRRGGGRAIAPAPLSSAETQQAHALYAKTCAACHGQQLEGVVGPSLVGVGSRYSLAKIERIAQRGKGKNKPVSMPAGLATPDQARLLARWLAAGPNVTAQAPVSHSSVEAAHQERTSHSDD